MTPTGCSLCGAVGRIELHHPTRRACRGGHYWDAGFVVALCASCHATAHQLLRVAALDWPGGDADPLAYRLRTTALHVELFTAQGSTFPILPASAPAFAALLREAAGAVDTSTSARAGAA